jgi:hypothetical protein
LELPVRIIALALLGSSTLANAWLCRQLHQRMTAAFWLSVIVLSGLQGATFVILIKTWTVTQATIAYDVVVVICWYGMLFYWNESSGWQGRLGILLIGVGAILAGR